MYLCSIKRNIMILEKIKEKFTKDGFNVVDSGINSIGVSIRVEAEETLEFVPFTDITFVYLKDNKLRATYFVLESNYKHFE